MTAWEWGTLAATYPFALALIVIWIQGATRLSTPAPAPARPKLPTMTVTVFGRPVARWQILEHAAPDGEVLEFPVFDGRGTWTIDDVADAIAEIDALPEVAS